MFPWDIKKAKRFLFSDLERIDLISEAKAKRNLVDYEDLAQLYSPVVSTDSTDREGRIILP